MAKKKKQINRKSITPENYIKEKARKLPLGKCYMNKNWAEEGIAHIIVTRLRPDGYYVLGEYIIDTFCLGVTDAMWSHKLSGADLNRSIDMLREEAEVEEVEYVEAHNMIYGALEFAEEGGIYPHRGFLVAQYILEEDTDLVELIEYDFGCNGRHKLIISSNKEEERYIGILSKNLGDEFDIERISPDHEEGIEKESYNELISRMMENFEKQQAEDNRYLHEPFHYVYPDYPSELCVRHKDMIDLITSSEKLFYLDKNDIDYILSLPEDEVVEDLNNLIIYKIGQIVPYIKSNSKDLPSDDGGIFHALMILREIGNAKALRSVFELMRQHDDLLNMEIVDYTTELISSVVACCGEENIDEIEKLLYTPGLNLYQRENLSEALVSIALKRPDLRGVIEQKMIKLLKSLPERLPKLEACDAHFAAFFICDLIDLGLSQYLPEIKKLYDIDMVNKTIVGSFDSVKKDILNPTHHKQNFKKPDIYEEYAWIEKRIKEGTY